MSVYPLDFSGRYYAYTNLRWVSQRVAYGVSTENHNQNFGLGADPVPPRDAQGHLVRAGSVIKDIAIRPDVNNSQVTAFDAAIIHVDNAGVSSILWRGLSLAVSTNASVNMSFIDLGSGVVIPSDGVLMFAIKPIGVLSATRYISASVNVMIDTGGNAETVRAIDGGDVWTVQALSGGDVVATLFEVSKTAVDGSDKNTPVYRVKDYR